MAKKGATNKSYIPISSEKFRNAVMACGTNIYALEKKLGYKPNSWSGYRYKNAAMPQDLFFKIIDELGIDPEDIAAEDHELYGRSWNSKKEMVNSLQRIFIRIKNNQAEESDLVDALAKYSPYLVPRAIQTIEVQSATPDREPTEAEKDLVDKINGLIE